MRCRTIIKFRNSDDPNDLGFGRGIVQLLEGVEEYGSINRATASMGMAYSKAWKIINSIEKEFDVRLIDREGAHGSHLTEEARTLIQRYHEALDAADAAAQTVFRKYYPCKGFSAPVRITNRTGAFLFR